MGDSDEEQFIFWGTPLKDDFEARAGQYRKGPVKDAGSTRQLPLWKQVRIEKLHNIFCSFICTLIRFNFHMHYFFPTGSDR